MIALPLAQGSPEWLAYRRTVITGTAIPILLGLSPWRCEADLADEMLGLAEPQPPSVAMRRGLALEPLLAELYTEQTGRPVVKSEGMVRHPSVEWAAASLDYLAGDRVVELKTTGSRTRFADGLPQDVEAQVAWQLGCSGLDVADVLVMVGDDVLPVFTVRADPALFGDLLAVAQDFRRRLAEGGPFATSDERVRRQFPSDDGTVLPATPDLVALARELADARSALKEAEAREKTVASALRAVLLGASGIEGVLTYRKSADSTRVNWPAVALAYRQMLAATVAEAELDALVSIHSETRTGPRVLRLSKETSE